MLLGELRNVCVRVGGKGSEGNNLSTLPISANQGVVGEGAAS
jgi:hypothetical protein